MIYILRTVDGTAPPDVRVLLTRRTPSEPARRDHFCVADTLPDASNVVPLHDGWYPDDHGGGVAVWGGGRFWEVRPTPFEVRLSDVDSA